MSYLYSEGKINLHTNLDLTHHAICLSCHKIFPVDVELEKGYERYMDREYGFEAVEPRVEIYGYCKDCRASGKDKAYKEKMGL